MLGKEEEGTRWDRLTSGLFFIFIKIVKKKRPSLGPGAAGAEIEFCDIV
jgi:hypothetical protein